jgi:hypothetical protein
MSVRQLQREKYISQFLYHHHVWVLKPLLPQIARFVGEDKELLVNLEVLDYFFVHPPACSTPAMRLVFCHLIDASLSIGRTGSPNWVSYLHDLKWDNVCFDRILDPALHGYVEAAAYFGPLSDVRSSIVRQITKNGVNQRCQGRNSEGMAIKKIVTRQVEKTRQRGSGANHTIAVHRYQGYVFRCCKQWMLCSLKGDYEWCDHAYRPVELEIRRMLTTIFTDPKYERWVVKLIHQCIHLLTASVREFMCYSIHYNPPLKKIVSDLMQLDTYKQITEQALNEARCYFRRYLVSHTRWHSYGSAVTAQSDLVYSFRHLPDEPAYLQHFYVCGSPRCTLPCPHKFMKSKEIKKATSSATLVDEEVDEMVKDMADDIMRELIQDTAKDFSTVTVIHRQDEVQREKRDTLNEQKSGWRWKPCLFHEHLNVIFEEMDNRASDISYSRPWKLVVLFRPMRKRRPDEKKLVFPIPSALHRRTLRHIVERCGPVRCGDAMARIVGFFPLLGVDEETTAVLQDLLVRFKDESTTENKLQDVMTYLSQHRSHAYNLFQLSWTLLKYANDHFYTTLLPYHIAWHQLEALRQVYQGMIVAQATCFVFCPGCHHIYSHLMDANTMYAKVFRYGLLDAEVDPNTGRLFCQRDPCHHELIQIPLVGRVLYYKTKVIMICPQPRCARFMVLDHHDKNYTMYTEYGPACCMCMPSMLYSSRTLRRLDDLYLDKKSASSRCCITIAHSFTEGKGAKSKRSSATQLRVLMHGVVICARHYHPDMAAESQQIFQSMYGVAKTFTEIQDAVITSAHKILERTLFSETAVTEKRKRMIERTSRGGGRNKRVKQS